MRSGSRLEPILASVRAHAQARRRRQPLAALRAELVAEPARRARFRAALARPRLSVIAECKRRSPSAGALAAGDGTDLAARAAAYAAGGADAISILTEAEHFGGCLADLAAVAGAGLPRLRKDFLLDEGMVLESVAAGADAVLLIAACLPDARLAELRACAAECGLAVLLEIHEEAELERALAVAPDALGVNARDLRSFAVDLGTVERLLPRIPAGVPTVAESGVHGLAELRRMAAAGADAVLLGTALMRADDPAATLAGWRAALAAPEAAS